MILGPAMFQGPGRGGHTRGSDGFLELSFEEAKLCASSRSLSPSVCPSSLEQKLCSVVRRVWGWGLLSLGLVAASWSPFVPSPVLLFRFKNAMCPS